MRHEGQGESVIETAVPLNLMEYLRARLNSLHPSARLVFVLDPPGRLALESTLPIAGRVWDVYRYDGNDLAFRRTLSQADSAAPSQHPMLIWATDPPGQHPPGFTGLDLSSVTDLLCRADDWFDLSLDGVLQDLVPGETWPVEVLEVYATTLASNLPATVRGHRELRIFLDQGAVLDAPALRALTLHVQQPDMAVRDVLFHKDTPAQVLERYIRLAWGAEWDADALGLLRDQAASSAQAQIGGVAPWFSVNTEALANYLYLRRLLAQARVPNIANQLRGLGVLGFDPEPLEPWVDQVLSQWDKDPAWRQRVVSRAEASLAQSDLRRAVALLPDKDATSLTHAETPAVIYELTYRLLANTPKDLLGEAIAAWRAYRPKALGNLPETRYTKQVEALGGFMDEVATVSERLAHDVDHSGSLASLVDSYVAAGCFDLEYACARAANHLRGLPDYDLATTLRAFLDEMRQRTRSFLQLLDEELALQLQSNWSGYLSSPRLSTHVLWDLVRLRRLKPGQNACMWVVIFDGMRWDTWQRVVRPRLLQHFEMAEPEKAYLSLVPSWTFVARGGILAGCPPVGWKGPDGRFTTNQKLLAARLFEIPSGEVDNRLQFYSGVEADRTYNQLDRDARYPWNVLIFNVSDDNLHQERDNLVSLNAGIEGRLTGILQTLESLVRPQDTVILTSDHGFMELNAEDGMVVEEDARWQRESQGLANPVRFRYITGSELPQGVPVRYPQLRESPFTVAVGRRWFRRSDDRHPPDRYAHGGLSFAEMVVPGAILRRVVEKRVDVEILEAPPSLELEEGKTATLEVIVGNTGNQVVTFGLVVKADSDSTHQVFQETLLPGDRRVLRPAVTPVFREKGGSTRRLSMELTYQDTKGVTQHRQREVAVTVKPRPGVVELQFGGLDDLDGQN
jgi:hypothetical protein